MTHVKKLMQTKRNPSNEKTINNKTLQPPKVAARGGMLYGDKSSVFVMKILAWIKFVDKKRAMIHYIKHPVGEIIRHAYIMRCGERES